MQTLFKSLAVSGMMLAAMSLHSFGQDQTSKELADNRTKVETAVALANIAMTEKDGDALLVAVRLLASAGPVAQQGESAASGKPKTYDLAAMAASAKEMGADAAKADEVAKASPTAAARGYWYYSCDSYNNCIWLWVGD